jgi:hypothetical protein
MKRIVKEYIWREMEEFEEMDMKYKEMKWHPDFSFYDITPEDKFVFSIDIADGAGKDYSVINIFRVEAMSIAAIRRIRRDRVEQEDGFFRLVQVGMFRSNKAGAEDLSKIASILLFKVFSPDNVRVALEMNFKGDYFVEKLSKHPDFYEDIFLHTKHNEKTKHFSLGIKIHAHNKMFFCREFRKLVVEKRIVLNEQLTFEEMNDFGINNRGTYSSQSGHDDIAMTCVFLVPFIASDSFTDFVEEVYDNVEDKYKDLIQKRLSEVDNEQGLDSISFLKQIL